MESVSDCVDFVKQQIDYQDRRATMTRGEPTKLRFHVEKAKQFRSLLQFLVTLPSFIEAHSENPRSIEQPIGTNPVAPLLPKELVGLPQELINELSGKGSDKQEILITELIDSAGGTLSLDRILIGIYNKSGVIMKRPTLTAKIYRMIQKEMVFPVPKKKGIYTTELSSDAADTKTAEIPLDDLA